MNKPKAQGTAWETAFVRMAQDAGLIAQRLPEGGANDAGDVWLIDTPSRDSHYNDVAVVAWSRLVHNGEGRRVPDGARSVVVMSTDAFLDLALRASNTNIVGDPVAFVVECKATEKLNVTRALGDAKRKLANWKKR